MLDNRLFRHIIFFGYFGKTLTYQINVSETVTCRLNSGFEYFLSVQNHRVLSKNIDTEYRAL